MSLQELEQAYGKDKIYNFYTLSVDFEQRYLSYTDFIHYQFELSEFLAWRDKDGTLY